MAQKASNGLAPADGSAASSHGRDGASESTPLLDKQYGPLPMGQLLLLCFARMVEPWAFFSIFPFINQMVSDTGIPASSTGFYTGLIESSFCAVQCITMPLWGKFSDKRGRKPLLVISLYALAITSTLFGLAQNVWLMLAYRCVSGVFSGCNVSIRTMISEISNPKNQARAFSLWAFSNTVAIFLAPLAGGFLVDPAAKFPVFQDVEIFRKFPYLLPCMVTGVISLVAALSCSVFLKETLLPSHLRGDGLAASKHEMTTREILQAPGVSRVLMIYTFTFIMVFSYLAVNPVYQFTPVKLGGLGFSPSDISYFLAVSGVAQAFWNLVVFPWIHPRLGNKGILSLAAPGWILVIVASVFLNFASRDGVVLHKLWPFIIALAFGQAALSISYNTVTLALNDIAPSPESLGLLNGFSLSVSAGIKAICPVAITTVWAVGVKNQIFWGELGWAVYLILAVVYLLLCHTLPRKAWGLPLNENDIEEYTAGRVPGSEQLIAGASSFDI